MIAPASAGSKRSAVSESPNSPRAMRAIHVTPRQVARARHKVQLVALIAVPAARREMQDKSQNARRGSEHPRCIKTEGFGPNLLGLSNMTHGSEAHKTLFCQTFIDSHRSFEPETLPWPILDASTIDRLRSIPFWSVALAAERNAGKMVSGFAGLVSDPLIHQALAIQGIEETRHARLLEYMLAHYSVSGDVQPGNAWKLNRRSFIDFGYEECIDAFFGFGIFGLARQIQLFIPELTDIFEVILIEEARHVTFFVNWIAYERVRRHLGSLPARAAATALGYARAVRRIVATFAPTAHSPWSPRRSSAQSRVLATSSHSPWSPVPDIDSMRISSIASPARSSKASAAWSFTSRSPICAMVNTSS